MDKASKIVICQTASIGDVVLITPLIESLHKHFPEAQIDILIKKGTDILFKEHPFLNKIYTWDKSKSKYKGLFSILRQIRKEKYDLFVNVHRFGLSGLVAGLSKAKVISGFDKNPYSFLYNKRFKHIIGRDERHEIDRNHELISFIPDINQEKIRLYPSETDFQKVEIYKNGPYLCLAPSSLWYTKALPEGKWIEFLNALPENIKVYLLGSPSDNDLAESLITRAQNNRIENLCGKLTLLESAALMKDARMNYVNDSAPMHLCSAVDAPVVAIYCSTVPNFGFGPKSSNSHIIETEKKLECRPCGLHGHKECPESHFDCGYSININKLTELIDA